MVPSHFIWYAYLAFQNDQRQRRKDEVAAGTTWPLKHFNKLESDPVCAYFLLLRSRLFLNFASKPIRPLADELLADGTDITPQEEDCYVYQNNPPAWLV